MLTGAVAELRQVGGGSVGAAVHDQPIKVATAAAARLKVKVSDVQLQPSSLCVGRIFEKKISQFFFLKVQDLHCGSRRGLYPPGALYVKWVDVGVVWRGDPPSGLPAEVSAAAVDHPLKAEPVGGHGVVGDKVDVDAALGAGDARRSVSAAEVA